MKALLHLHGVYLLHRKTRVLLTIHFVVSAGVLLYLTRFFDEREARISIRAMYTSNYVFDGFHSIQFFSLVLILYLALALFHDCPYDVMCVQRTTKTKLLLSKWLTMVIVGILHSSLLMLFFTIFGMTAGFRFKELTSWTYIVPLWMMIMHYGSLSMLVLVMFRHVFSVFFILAGALTARVLVDVGVAIENLGVFALCLNAVFANVHILENGSTTMLFNIRTFMILIVSMMVATVIVHAEKDM